MHVQSTQTRHHESVALLENSPEDAIRFELPVQCRYCPALTRRLGEMAFWVSDRRVSPEYAAEVLLEKSECTSHQSIPEM
jgi:hypothetical protein